MVSVRKKSGESDDKLIARFRKKVAAEGVLDEYRKHERHVSKSEERKEKKYRIRHNIELEKRRN